jgi:hypothetical protein
MKPLILASSPTPDFYKDDFSDLAAGFFFHFVWGELPSPSELATYLGPRATDHDPIGGRHWSDFADRWGQSKNKSFRNLGLAEFCQQYEVVELWFDTRPDAQLRLIWLLDYFRFYPETVGKLRLRLLDQDLIGMSPGGLGEWRPRLIDVTEQELATASAAWKAYRASTPEACFGLLSKDLSALPLLKPVLLDLLAELPSASTGLGATEMRMLELIGRGYFRTNALFHLESLRQTRVSASGRRGTCWMVLRSAPSLRLQGSMKSCAPWNEKICEIVTRPTSAVNLRSPNSADRSLRTQRRFQPP